MNSQREFKLIELDPARLLILGFATLILIGTFLFMLPIGLTKCPGVQPYIMEYSIPFPPSIMLALGWNPTT